MGEITELSFALYDSFATRRFEGSVAGVVLGPRLPSDRLMQAVAAELGAPTTGFADVTDARSPTVRLYTPRREIGACGHVSLAIAIHLSETGVWRVAQDRRMQYSLTTASGPIPVRVFLQNGISHASLLYSPVSRGTAESDRATIQRMLGREPDHDLPVEVVHTGIRHLIIGFPSVQDLEALNVAERPVRMLAELNDVDTICAFSSLGSRRVRMRDLTGAIGVPEEAASGTTSSAVALYAQSHGLLGRGSRLSIEQGVELGRPSLIEVELERVAPARVWVTGTAIYTAAGTVRVSETHA